MLQSCKNYLTLYFQVITQKMGIQKVIQFFCWIYILFSRKMSEEDELKQHQQKWKKWNEQRQRQQIKKKLNVEDGIENYAANLIQKMNNPFQKNNDKQTKQLTKQISNQIQSNVCSICLQLMIPPEHHPVILFPCGHNICKDCLFEYPPKGQFKKNMKLKLEKCSLCRQRIESYALNQSLMTLICTYSNNKQLLEKERKLLEQQEQNQEKHEDIQQIRIRCEILQKEQRSLMTQAQKFSKQKRIVAEVIQALKGEKRRNEKQLQKIEEEGKLIAKCLTQKLQQMQIIEKRLKDAQDKQRVLQKALFPLKKQKEKQQLLEIARLISKK